jgi:hypothetical protein
MQTLAASVQKLSDSVVKSAELATDRVDVSCETIRLSISLRSAVDFLHVTYIKINKSWYIILFYLLWTNRDSSVSSVPFSRVP